MDNNIRGSLKLHSKQFDYRAGRSTVDALHHLLKEVEGTLNAKEILLAMFDDIGGAFDNTIIPYIPPYAMQPKGKG